MNENNRNWLSAALLIGTTMVVVQIASAQPPAGSRAPGANLALVATASTSFVSGHETIAALNDGYNPQHSNDKRRGAYGNWPQTGTQSVQYEWSQPISTGRVDVYWFDDDRGVRLPKACRLQYWDGNRFVPVIDPSGLGCERNKFNTTTFPEVRTSRLRLEIDSQDRYSTGILEWRVYDSGKSPGFPPRVTAGADRLVVAGGRTYLNGKVKTLASSDSPPVVWSKASGPGAVTFADAGSPATSATFSQAGEYELRLTAGQGSLTSSSTLRVKVVPAPPATHLDPVDTQAYRIDHPLWNDRAKALIVNWIPHCIRKISDPDVREGGINNFIAAADVLAGKPHANHRGPVFSNAWVYNTIESICLALMIDSRDDGEILAAQKAMRATLEDWIPKILAAQEPDGYLQTAFTLSDRQRWSPRSRGDHEGYVAGYFLDAAVAHYAMTNGADRRLYDAAKKLADCWDAHLGPAPKKPWYDGHQAMELALVRFGRLVNRVEGSGRGEKYIALAKFLLDCRRDGSEYDQSHVPVIQQYEAVGHAVRASYSYAAMAAVAMLTSDKDYPSAVISLWDNLVNRKYYVTGGIGSGETSEGFGPDYSLRNNAYCESCSSCGEVYFQHWLNMTYRDARYADLCEETLYNAILGSIDLEGKNFYYQNPLDERRLRYDWHACPCCVGNIPRTLLALPTWMYARSDGGLYVNLFVGSTVNVGRVAGTDVQVVQATDYPWSGKVSITVNPATEKAFAIHVRAPSRSVSELYTATPDSDGILSLSVNGSATTPVIRNGYAVIERTWKAGDRVELVLPMRVQRVKSSDKVAANVGRVALRLGPLIYNVESVDQDIDQTLTAESPLATDWRSDLLRGVLVVTGRFSNGAPMTAIPNYARLNRSGRSLVWIKDQ